MAFLSQKWVNTAFLQESAGSLDSATLIIIVMVIVMVIVIAIGELPVTNVADPVDRAPSCVLLYGLSQTCFL